MKNPQRIQEILAGFPPGVSLDHFVSHPHTVELFVSWKEPKPGDTPCPHCGCMHCVRKDNGTTQTLRHAPSAGVGILFTFHKPRLLCRNCGRSFYAAPPWAVPDMSITQGLFLLIYSELTSTSHSVLEIADHTRTSPSIVRNVMNHIDLTPPHSLPESLGIDEFLGNTGTYNRLRKRYDTEKYQCVITDADLGCVIDILQKATFQELKNYFMQFPLYQRQNVKYFCTDLRPGFSKVARACFPKAKICLDPFHVVQLLTRALSDIRVEEWRRLRDLWVRADLEARNCPDPARKEELKALATEKEADFTLVKNSQRLLVTSPYNDDRYWNCNVVLREEKLSKIFALSPDLKLAREALLKFYDVSKKELSQRRAALSDWIEAYISCEIPGIRKAANTINTHRAGIENAWRFHKSNSPTEGINKRIKDVKRMAFGAHDFSNFRKRVMLSCGLIHFSNPVYTIKSEKSTEIPDSRNNSGR